MIGKKTLGNRLRRHRKLKALNEARLKLAESDQDKNHYKARVAEIDRDIEAIKGVTLTEPKALLPAITKTAEENAKKAEEHMVQPMNPKPHKPKSKPNKVKRVGNPF